MSFASDMKKVAKDLLKTYADDIEIIQVTQGAYNPSTGESPKTEVITPSKGFAEFYATNQLIQGVINIDDVRMIIETDIVITKQDIIQYRGSRYEVINYDETRTQNTTIIYTLQIRK